MADLGTYKGSGTWGVTTLKMNPVTNEPMVVLFENEGQAIDYARMRAMRAGPPIHRPGLPPDRTTKGRIYYILRYLPHQYDNKGQRAGSLLYRVMRGMRGETQAYHGSIPSSGDEMVVVSRYVQTRQTPKGEKHYWEAVPALSVRVPDLEAEYEKQRFSKGTQRLSRADMGREPRGHKQRRLRQGRGPKFGPVPDHARTPRARGLAPTVEYKAARESDAEMYAQQREAHALFVAQRRERLATLVALKETMEQEYLKTRDQKLFERIHLVEEKITAEHAWLEKNG